MLAFEEPWLIVWLAFSAVVCRCLSKDTGGKIDYSKNLRSIQKLMRAYCTVHASISCAWHRFSHDPRQKTVLLLVAGGICLAKGRVELSTVLKYGPVAFVLLGNQTSVRKGWQASMMLLEWKGDEETANVAEFVVYESQRWWLGIGWIPTSINSDPPPFVKVSRTAIQVLSVEELCQMSCSGWSLDINKDTDEDGWSYSNSWWRGQSRSSRFGVYTRERRWIPTI